MPPYRWLTPGVVIEPIGQIGQRWRVIDRQDQRAMGDVWLDQASVLHCPIDARARTRQAVALCIQNQLRQQQPNQTCDLDGADDALLELNLAHDHTATIEQQYLDEVVECCDRLGVARNYGEQRRLSLMREPVTVVSIGRDVFDRPQYMSEPAARHWQAMCTTARDDKIILQPVSAFRDYYYQAALINNKLGKGQPLDRILDVNAAPGYSEHHTGRALDITTPDTEPLEETFAESNAFAWLQQRAGEFGFVMSYPAGNVHNLAYEPWHWCWQA